MFDLRREQAPALCCGWPCHILYFDCLGRRFSSRGPALGRLAVLLKTAAHVIPTCLKRQAGESRLFCLCWKCLVCSRQCSSFSALKCWLTLSQGWQQLSGMFPFPFPVKMHPLSPISNKTSIFLQPVFSRLILCLWGSWLCWWGCSGDTQGLPCCPGCPALLWAPGAVGTEAQGGKPWVDLLQIHLPLSQALYSSEGKPVLLVNFPAQAEIHSGTCPHLTGVITKGSWRYWFVLQGPAGGTAKASNARQEKEEIWRVGICVESNCLSFCSHLLWGQCLPSTELHQTTFLVKPEERNNAVMMRIWLRAQDDMATRTELMALLLDTFQGRAGSLGTAVTGDTM